MKRIIFTLYKNLKSDNKLDILNHKKIKQYYIKLLKNKADYAEKIGVDFKLYDSHTELLDKQNIFNQYYSFNDFVEINLYKHFLMQELADEYDEILYVDFDVLFNTDENFFEVWDLSKGIVIKDQNDQIKTKNINENADIRERSPTLKYFITYDLLGKQNNNVINTGIIGATSKYIKKLNFTKRFFNIKNKIEKLKDESHEVRKLYYPNNEAIFSYILEKYNIPYQLMNDEWHDIRDHNIVERPLGKIIHFINKIFEIYYKEKSRIVFSLYIDIPKKKLDNPGKYIWDKKLNKSERTKLEFKKYWDKLLDNKKEYAKNIGADWKLFGNDKQYKEFAKRFPNISEYNIVNFYKIYLIEELTKKYDYVLYLDFDVVANRMIDFFEYNDVEKYICCQTQSITHDLKLDTNNYKRDYRAPIVKYWNCHALLAEHDIDYENKVAFNTGIVGASKKTMKQLKYFDDIDDTIQLMTELKNDEDSFYPPQIRELFGYDNEAVFGYKIRLNELDYENLNSFWHYRMDWKVFNQNQNELIKRKNSVLIHFINKKFDWFFK